MLILTPSERRGAWLLVALLVLGSGYDLWCARPGVERTERWERAGRAADSSAGDGASRRAGAAREPAGDLDLPAPGSAEARHAPFRSSPAVESGGSRIDLNHADLRQLDALPGVGPVLAGRIVEHRRRYGRFQRVEDLLSVRGIGRRLLERLRPYLIADSLGRRIVHPP